MPEIKKVYSFYKYSKSSQKFRNILPKGGIVSQKKLTVYPNIILYNPKFRNTITNYRDGIPKFWNKASKGWNSSQKFRTALPYIRKAILKFWTIITGFFRCVARFPFLDSRFSSIVCGSWSISHKPSNS